MQLYLVGLEKPRSEGPLEQPIIADTPDQAFDLWLDFVVCYGAKSLRPDMEVYIIAMPLPDANARVLRWHTECEPHYRIIPAHELAARANPIGGSGLGKRTPY